MPACPTCPCSSSDPARDELRRALAHQPWTHGIREQEFKARHNLGCLAYYAGQLPEAIRLMREADDVDAPVSRARAKHDLALCLLEAGLLDQAHETLRAALGEARSAPPADRAGRHAASTSPGARCCATT